MKMFKISIYVVLMCSLFGCAPSSHVEETRSEKVILAQEMLKVCAATLSKRHQLSQSGSGGAMMYEVKDLFLAFHIYRSLSRDEARAMLLDCAQEVIETVNHNERIQKYLLPGGFNEKSVQIQIYIHPNHKRNSHPDIGVCAYNFGKLRYHSNDPDNSLRYKTSELETYSEALALHEAYLAQNSSESFRDLK